MAAPASPFTCTGLGREGGQTRPEPESPTGIRTRLRQILAGMRPQCLNTVALYGYATVWRSRRPRSGRRHPVAVLPAGRAARVRLGHRTLTSTNPGSAVSTRTARAGRTRLAYWPAQVNSPYGCCLPCSPPAAACTAACTAPKWVPAGWWLLSASGRQWPPAYLGGFKANDY